MYLWWVVSQLSGLPTQTLDRSAWDPWLRRSSSLSQQLCYHSSGARPIQDATAAVPCCNGASLDARNPSQRLGSRRLRWAGSRPAWTPIVPLPGLQAGEEQLPAVGKVQACLTSSCAFESKSCKRTPPDLGAGGNQHGPSAGAAAKRVCAEAQRPAPCTLCSCGHLRGILGVSRRAPTAAVLAEFGTCSLAVHWARLAARFQNHAQCMEDDRPVRWAATYWGVWHRRD